MWVGAVEHGDAANGEHFLVRRSLHEPSTTELTWTGRGDDEVAKEFLGNRCGCHQPEFLFHSRDSVETN